MPAPSASLTPPHSLSLPQPAQPTRACTYTKWGKLFTYTLGLLSSTGDFVPEDWSMYEYCSHLVLALILLFCSWKKGRAFFWVLFSHWSYPTTSVLMVFLGPGNSLKHNLEEEFRRLGGKSGDGKVAFWLSQLPQLCVLFKLPLWNNEQREFISEQFQPNLSSFR